MIFSYQTVPLAQHENAKTVTFFETTSAKKCTLLNMLSAEEITALQVFGNGGHRRKVVAVSRMNLRISIGQVVHGPYFRPKGIVLDNGDHISLDRTRYNFRTPKTEPVALFKWSERWQYEYDIQSEYEELETWLQNDSVEDLFFVAEYVAVMSDLKTPQHYGFRRFATKFIRDNLYRLNLSDLRWLTETVKACKADLPS